MPVINNGKTKTASGDLLWSQDIYGSDGNSQVLAGQLRAYANAQATAGAVPCRLEFWTMNSSGTLTEAFAIGADQSFGYGGNGGAVTQLTNKGTGVELNTPVGEITMNNASLASQTTVSFTLTNSVIAATDLLVLNHASAGTVGAYAFNAQAGAGSAVINVRNVTLNNLGEAIVIRYAVIKGVNA